MPTRLLLLLATSTLCLPWLTGCNPTQVPVHWSGYAEGEYIYLAAPVAGTLTRLSVQRGQSVAAQAPLFRLDDTPAQAALAESDARLLVAEAQAADSAKGHRSDELAVTQAQLAQARAHATLTQTELRRQQQLLAQSFIAPSAMDGAAAAAQQANERVTELEAVLRVAKLPARSDAQAAARANTEAATQARAQLQWRQQQATQIAPAAGLVADTFFRVGEYVPAGQPVLALLPPEGIKARFFVPETALGTLAVGQTVLLGCDGCGDPIQAHISYIAPQAEYTPPVIYSNTQRTRLVFMVEARPGPADMLRLHPGQPLDVQSPTGAHP